MILSLLFSRQNRHRIVQGYRATDRGKFSRTMHWRKGHWSERQEIILQRMYFPQRCVYFPTAQSFSIAFEW